MNKHTKDIRNKTDQELGKLFHEKSEGVRAFRFGLSGSRIRNVKEGRSLRRDRARIATELGARKKALAR